MNERLKVGNISADGRQRRAISRDTAREQIQKATHYALGIDKDKKRILVTSQSELHPVNPARTLTLSGNAVEIKESGELPNVIDLHTSGGEAIDMLKKVLFPLGSRYEAEVAETTRNVEPVPQRFLDVHNFLAYYQPNEEEFDASEIGQRYEVVAKDLPEALQTRLKQLYLGVTTLSKVRKSHGESGLRVPDADVIQRWALQLIEPQEFQDIAMQAFPEWADRLSDNPVAHIAQANEWLGEKIANLLKGKDTIKYVDLGFGTSRTIKAVVNALHKAEVNNVDVAGVDITDNLKKIATDFLDKNEIQAQLILQDAVSWLEGQEDNSLDVVTMNYAIHHLAYEEQAKLEKLIFQKLKSGGMYGMSDPTGASDYNLAFLDIVEPEATAACFRPQLTDVVAGLENIGFTIDYSGVPQEVVGKLGTVSTEISNTLDQGRLGYGLVAVKK